MSVNVICPKCGGGRDISNTAKYWKCPHCMITNEVVKKLENENEEIREPERPVFDISYIASEDIEESVEEESTEEA